MVLPTNLRENTLFTLIKNAGEDICNVRIYSETADVDTDPDTLNVWKRDQIISARFHSKKFAEPYDGVFAFTVEYRDSLGETVVKRYSLLSPTLIQELQDS